MKNLKIPLRITAFLLMLVMLFSVTACRKNEADNSSSEPTGSDSSIVDTTASDEVDATSKDETSTSSGSTTTTSKTKVFAADPYSEISSTAKSKSVKVLLWQKPSQQESQRMTDFTKKTGIKVECEYVSETVYNDTLISRISAGNSPDVVFFNPESFPSNVIKMFSALDPTVYKLEDPFWDKEIMDQFKINGNYYGVNVNGGFSEDVAMVLFYNKTLLDNNNISDPYTMWKNGTWNWSTFETLLAKVKASSSLTQYKPLYLYQPNAVIGSAGASLISYDGKKFSSNINDSTLITAYQQLASWREKGYISAGGLAGNNAAAGNFVFYSCIAYHLKAQDSYFGPNGTSQNGQIRAVPFPSPKGSKNYVATRVKMFGTAKGAKNKEGAAYFLRYYLDPANQDMNNAFQNAQAKEVWDYIHKQTKVIDFAESVISYVNSSSYDNFNNTVMAADPSQIRKTISEQSNIVTKAVSTVNSKVLKVE